MIFDEKTASAFPVSRFPIFQPIGARFRPSEAPLSASSLSLDIFPFSPSHGLLVAFLCVPGAIPAIVASNAKLLHFAKPLREVIPLPQNPRAYPPFEYRGFFCDAAPRSPVRDPVGIEAPPPGLDPLHLVRCIIAHQAKNVTKRPIFSLVSL